MILVIGEENWLLNVIALLQEFGYLVKRISGYESIQELRRENPLVVIINEESPPYEVLDLLPKLCTFISAPKILLCSYSERRMRWALFGGIDHYSYDETPRAIAARVEALLRRHAPEAIKH